jgi:hypothetical protein
LLGEVVDEVMRLNDFGKVAHDFWRHVPVHFPGVSIGAYVVMPNHLHAIVMIQPASTVAGGEEEGEETSPLRDGQDDGRGAVAAPTGVGPSNRRSRIERPALG